MFKFAAGASLLSVAQAIAINQGAGKIETNVLAQTSAEVGSGCCCHAMPCMPTCMSQCEDEPWVPNITILPETPEPLRDIELNLDVILTHILHEIKPPNAPEPASPDETTLV